MHLSLFSLEVLHLVLFKVLIKQSQIRGILLTSNMDLCVTRAIGKVRFSSLIP